MPNVAHKKPHRLFANAQWQALFDEFIASIRSPLTRTQYTATLRRFFAYIAQKYPKHTPTPDKITPADIDEFLRQPIQSANHCGETPSPSTQNTYLRTIRAFYAYCEHAEIQFRGKLVPALRKDAPTTHVKARKVGDVERDFTDGELEAFFAAIDTNTLIGKRDHALFLTLLNTVRRRCEIATLRRGDLEKRTFIENGHRRTGWTYQFLGKQRVERETAEMPLNCIEEIRQFHMACGLDFETEPPEHPLFFGISGKPKKGQPLSLALIDHHFKKYAKAAAISESVVVHSLRYEYAWTRYQENGCNIVEVQEAVGWQSIEQTLHYIKRRKRKQMGDPLASKMSARFAHL
jgi:integrase